MTELTPIRRGRCAGAGNWQTQYQALQMTAREAAELIRDGDTAALRRHVQLALGAGRGAGGAPAGDRRPISPSTGTSSPPEPGC